MPASIRHMLEELEVRTFHARAALSSATRGRERSEPEDGLRPSF